MKYLALDDMQYQYLLGCRSDAPDPVLNELRAETAKLGDDARMQISPEQGTLLSILTAAIGTKSAIEIGTFTGYSSICIARALSPGGKLLCLDESDEWTQIARRYWKKADVDEKIELRLGAALSSLESLPADATFDLAFIDAAKAEYNSYFELVLPHVRQNGLILLDNMLWGGRLAHQPVGEDTSRVIHQLNQKLAADDRVECVLIAVADGIQICRKR